MPTALVTGTSTGIGEACVARLAGHGWTVHAGVRRDEDGRRLAEQCTGDVRPVLLDVSDRDRMRRVVDDLASATGTTGLQGLVNNAGIGVGGPVEYLGEDDWRRVFDVNFFSVIALTQMAMPLLRAGRGRIVDIGSVGGRLAAPGLAPYSASKHALEALCESMRHELDRSGSPVRVVLVEPGAVKTAIWAKADDSADEIERALGPEGLARYGWLVDEARGFIDDSRARGVEPEAVAEVVEQALTAMRPKPRYLVGPDAKFAGHVIARAPDRLRGALLDLNSRRSERRGKELGKAAG
jgi:NAD(P)-dependent dehydrogenase (short-subunit alcohol dehydrogenase family)